MTVIEREKTVEPIKLNEVQQTLTQIKGLVKQGKWCRNVQDNGAGQGCMMGLIIRVSRDTRDTFLTTSELIAAVYRGIDLTDPVFALPVHTRVNGGSVRHNKSSNGWVCTYNNTRKDEGEILDWLDRSILLAQ
jgi:hypothetical protein